MAEYGYLGSAFSDPFMGYSLLGSQVWDQPRPSLAEPSVSPGDEIRLMRRNTGKTEANCQGSKPWNTRNNPARLRR